MGRRQRDLGDHRRDLRAPRLRREPVFLDSRPGPRAGRHLHRRERGGQDLRHDRLAGRLDDRPARRGQGCRQPAVPRHVERRQRVPDGGAGRPHRRHGADRTDAGGVRPPPAEDVRDVAGDARRALPGAGRRLLRLPVLRRRPGPPDRRLAGRHHLAAGRRGARQGQGGHRARGGIRRPRLRPPVLRPGRRRAGRGPHPPGGPARRQLNPAAVAGASV